MGQDPKNPHFPDFVRALLELERHFEAERLGGLEVDYQIELARLLHWQVGGLFDRYWRLRWADECQRRWGSADELDEAPQVLRGRGKQHLVPRAA